MKLTVATSQFPVSQDVAANARAIRRQMRLAKRKGAAVIHFCEGALSGYPGHDLRSFCGYDWEALRAHSEGVAALAGELGLWVLLGSSHPLRGEHKPHNSVYVIDARRQIIDRYDKMFCAGDKRGTVADLAHYTPGEHFCVFDLEGVRCGLLICHEYRYPELYREYKRRGVELMFHSFHAGNMSDKQLARMREQVGAANHRFNAGTTLPEITMPAAMIAAAASSHVWISAANSSARESCWPSFFVRADGVVTGRLRRNVGGVLVSEVDTKARLYDSTKDWRGRAMRGQYHTGKLVKDPRSRRRDTF